MISQVFGERRERQRDQPRMSARINGRRFIAPPGIVRPPPEALARPFIDSAHGFHSGRLLAAFGAIAFLTLQQGDDARTNFHEVSHLLRPDTQDSSQRQLVYPAVIAERMCTSRIIPTYVNCEATSAGVQLSLSERGCQVIGLNGCLMDAFSQPGSLPLVNFLGHYPFAKFPDSSNVGSRLDMLRFLATNRSPDGITRLSDFGNQKRTKAQLTLLRNLQALRLILNIPCNNTARETYPVYRLAPRAALADLTASRLRSDIILRHILGTLASPEQPEFNAADLYCSVRRFTPSMDRRVYITLALHDLLQSHHLEVVKPDRYINRRFIVTDVGRVILSEIVDIFDTAASPTHTASMTIRGIGAIHKIFTDAQEEEPQALQKLLRN